MYMTSVAGSPIPTTITITGRRIRTRCIRSTTARDTSSSAWTKNLKATFYVYFDNGQLRTVTQNLTLPDSTMHSIGTNYTYDDVGNLLSITDAKAQQTSFAYDELNRQIRKTFPDGTFELFRYDTAGNLTGPRAAY